jgi:hypothetical protein
MTALPPEERPSGRPEPSDQSARLERLPAGTHCPSDEVLELLATVVAFQASMECLESRRPARGHPLQARRWRREREVLLLQRQMLKLRVEALPTISFAPFPRPTV